MCYALAGPVYSLYELKSLTGLTIDLLSLDMTFHMTEQQKVTFIHGICVGTKYTQSIGLWSVAP